MKRILLIIFLGFTFHLASAQSAKSGGCDNCGDAKSKRKVEMSVYPNPASDYIGITEDDDIEEINVYNLVGKRIKNFQAYKGQRYNIADIPTGVYLVQLMGDNGKIITTQRLSKR
ncbi:MAG: T9SS type A sorting domain-containing protein [Saprospiraceae bacterium]|nr:T9SS type A sorting domain-containing protein [Saprospiraceae bacterium]